MAARPRIGIPLCTDDRGRWRRGRRYQYIHTAYAQAIERVGGMPLYLPIQAHAADVVAGLDALLVPGGDDLPAPEGRAVPEPREPIPDDQLAFDRALLGAALARGLPILGICYGMQLLCIEHGGELYYDLAREGASGPDHWLTGEDGAASLHDVEVTPRSRLHAILGGGRTTACVNSLHRQGVRSAGPVLCVAARARDGLVEAIEHPELPFCIGVQWHPEMLGDAASTALFAALISAAASGAEP